MEDDKILSQEETATDAEVQPKSMLQIQKEALRVKGGEI